MIRDEARRIAGNHLHQHGRDARIRDVLAWDEITPRKPVLYLTQPVRPEDYWVCYLEPRVMMLASSEIVVVSRETGGVLYTGSACDEG
jgi:hypothetical protein